MGVEDKLVFVERDTGRYEKLKEIKEKFSEFENDLETKGKNEEFFDAYRRTIEVLRDCFDSKDTNVKPRDAYIYYWWRSIKSSGKSTENRLSNR